MLRDLSSAEEEIVRENLSRYKTYSITGFGKNRERSYRKMNIDKENKLNLKLEKENDIRFYANVKSY